MSEKTIFTKIIAREVPADIVYEDERCLAIRDINPQAPTHLLVIPKREIPSIGDTTERDGPLMGHLWDVIRRLAEQLQLDHGYRVVVNNGPDAGQEVPHLHFHLLGGRKFAWPPG